MCRLEGKVALVTGAASGIGECTARLFSRHGAKVVVADINEELGQKLCQDLDPSPVSFALCDVTKEKDIENAVDTTVSKYGKLDIMINNAGIAGEGKSTILEDEKSDFEKVIGTNLVGAFLGTKHAARVMIPSRSGSIITTASVCSVSGSVASHAYVSSKHAVLGLMRSTAADVGRYGIRANCVSPYIVATPLGVDFMDRNYGGFGTVYSHLGGAILKPEDVAEAALFLASDESKYISGHNLIVDGGFTTTNPNFSLYRKSEQ